MKEHLKTIGILILIFIIIPLFGIGYNLIFETDFNNIDVFTNYWMYFIQGLSLIGVIIIIGFMYSIIHYTIND